MEGLSLSAIARGFSVTKEAVRQWMMKFEEYFSAKTIPIQDQREADRPARRDEGVKRNGKIAYISTCLDLARREVTSARSYRSVSLISTVKRALALSQDRPIFIVDHAPWYACAFEWLEVEWVPLTFGIRSYIERWYRTFKDRTKRFYNNFGIRDDDKAIKGVERFVHLFAYWYNRMRPHETLKGATPSSLS
jgi:transposase-like protein